MQAAVHELTMSVVEAWNMRHARLVERRPVRAFMDRRRTDRVLQNHQHELRAIHDALAPLGDLARALDEARDAAGKAYTVERGLHPEPGALLIPIGVRHRWTRQDEAVTRLERALERIRALCEEPPALLQAPPCRLDVNALPDEQRMWLDRIAASPIGLDDWLVEDSIRRLAQTFVERAEAASRSGVALVAQARLEPAVATVEAQGAEPIPPPGARAIRTLREHLRSALAADEALQGHLEEAAAGVSRLAHALTIQTPDMNLLEAARDLHERVLPNARAPIAPTGRGQRQSLRWVLGATAVGALVTATCLSALALGMLL